MPQQATINLKTLGAIDPTPRRRSLLPKPPATEGPTEAERFTTRRLPMNVERDPYARPLGEDTLADVADFFSGATFGDGLDPGASQASSIGLAATAGAPGAIKGLYSKLLEGFKGALPKAVKADSLLNLAKKVGAKDEEIAYVGLRELAEGRRGQTIPREEVIAHVEGRLPQVKTTVLGEPQPDVSDIWGRAERGEISSVEAVEAAQARHASGPTKFSQHTLPGGEDYRETLIHLPDRKQHQSITPQEGAMQNYGRPWAELNPQQQQFVLENIDYYGAVGRGQENNFTAGHFNTPNVLAHARHNERRTPDGLNVRFLEEVQSDWHQKGKAVGYRGQQPIPPESQPAWEMLRAKAVEYGGEPWRQYPDQLANQLRMQANAAGVDDAQGTLWHNQADELDVLHERYGATTRQYADETRKVPDAPFKDTWQDLTLKQQLLDASEKGLDGIAWTPGQVQADRYNLAQHVQAVHYYPEGHVLRAQNHNGVTVIDEKVAPEKLADYIGKEAAERLLQTPVRASSSPENAGSAFHALENESLQIGGEGMREFYDKLLPKRMEKLIKPFGGTVEQAPIQLFASHDDKLNHVLDVGTPDNQLVYMRDNPQNTFTSWLTRLTPEIRERILREGFPLFLLALLARNGAFTSPYEQLSDGRR